ncbi:beta-ketoacyl synthase N-terminal-like domain-containing protein [Scytonema sp. NUACC26]
MDAIAIVGMAVHFPGAKNVNEFWQNLRDSVESIFIDVVNNREEMSYENY